MTELLYTKSSIAIAVSLILLMVLALNIGYMVGMRSTVIKNCKPCKEHISTLLSSLLGMLALILGFSFSIALERHGSRSEAVIEEANAIGTAYLRTTLLPEAYRPKAQQLFAQYLDVRLKESHFNLAQRAEREALNQQANNLQMQLWNTVSQAAVHDPNTVTTGLPVQAMNAMIDAYGKRYAELNRHIPELVLWLLFLAFIVCGGMLGYSAGISNHQPSKVVYVMLSVVVLVMYLVMDLDRPRRGLIHIDQTPMQSLKTLIQTSPVTQIPTQ
jgi:hypothetical protein